jgi:hypothetical protein
MREGVRATVAIILFISIAPQQGSATDRWVHLASVVTCAPDDPIQPKLKAPGSYRLKLALEKRVSISAFSFNLRHFNLVYAATDGTFITASPAARAEAGGLLRTSDRSAMNRRIEPSSGVCMSIHPQGRS